MRPTLSLDRTFLRSNVRATSSLISCRSSIASTSHNAHREGRIASQTSKFGLFTFVARRKFATRNRTKSKYKQHHTSNNTNAVVWWRVVTLCDITGRADHSHRIYRALSLQRSQHCTRCMTAHSSCGRLLQRHCFSWATFSRNWISRWVDVSSGTRTPRHFVPASVDPPCWPAGHAQRNVPMLHGTRLPHATLVAAARPGCCQRPRSHALVRPCGPGRRLTRSLGYLAVATVAGLYLETLLAGSDRQQCI